MESRTNESLLATATIDQPSEIANISLLLRIPPFWRDRVRLWFYSFEAAIHDQKKGEQQLAQMVIARLEKQDIEQTSDRFITSF
ncbi:unnamed protein product [Euphydryas editha]|uniref:Uncharacterized protein n=1 Tax=Euphydryas editha TaxID=104508 RepID=A0AAU9TQX3_EUPED|nr:unnamed protein product [Euphydryas editha]